MKKACITAGLLLLCACTHPKGYVSYGEYGGYSDDRLNDRVSVTRYVGIDETDPHMAELYSHFRAIEICIERGKNITRFWGTTDRTRAQTSTRSAYSEYRSPTEYTGQSSAYSGAWGVSYGASRFGTTSRWNETYIYPTYDTAFSCSNQAFGLGITVVPVKYDEIQAITGDLFDGIRIAAHLGASPNKETLNPGDILLKLGNVRIRTLADLGVLVDESGGKTPLVLTIARAGRLMQVAVKAIDTSREEMMQNRRIIWRACSDSQIGERLLCASRR